MAHIDVSSTAFPGIAGGANPAATHIKNPPPLLPAMDSRKATVAANYVFSPAPNSPGEQINPDRTSAPAVQSVQAQESVVAQAATAHAADVAAAQGSVAPTGTAAHFAAVSGGEVQAQAGYGGGTDYGNPAVDSSAPPVGFAPTSGPPLPTGSRSLAGEGGRPGYNVNAPENQSHYGGDYAQPNNIGGHPIGQFAV